MNGPLALAAERRRPLGRGPQPVGVGKVTERPVDRAQTMGPGGDDEAGEGVVPHIAPMDRAGAVLIGVREHRVIGVHPAHGGGPGLGRSGIVGGAEMQTFVAPAGAGDVIHVHHAKRGLDENLESDAPSEPLGRLDLGYQDVDRIDVAGVAGLGDHDEVELVPRLLDHLDHVAVHIGRIEAVDPDRDRLGAPVDLLQRADHVVPRRRLVIGRHRVLEVEEDDVGGRSGGLLEEFRPAARNRELAAVQTRDGLLDHSEAHLTLLAGRAR